MILRGLILLLLFAPLSRGGVAVLSQSRQFAIYAARRSAIPETIPPGSIAVEPELLAITAERVRQAVIAELPALASPGQRINLQILEEPTSDGSITILSTRFTDGWNYRVGIPAVVNENRLAKALIQSLFTEYAQRSAERGAEMPAWLIEGMVQEIYSTVGPKLIIDRKSTAWEGAIKDLKARTRETLRTNTPPTFNDLTTLAPPPPGAPAEAFYQSSAHLLVYSLLQRPNGPEKFASFLQMLSTTWNWQTAFRQAFDFDRMLEIEKWWALVATEFSTCDHRQAWSSSASLEKLNELLLTRVEYHASKDALAEARTIDLTTALREADWSFQRALLSDKITQLDFTAPQLAPEIGNLALAYKKILKSYLEKRESTNVRPGLPMPAAAFQQKIIDDTLKQIAELDLKKRSLAEPSVSSAR